MKKPLILALLLAFSLLEKAEARTPEAVVEAVFEQLWQAAGQLRFRKPTVGLAPEGQKVAAFYPSKNKILIDEKAYRVCREMGRDSLAALAFLIGHELAHAFQDEARSSRSATNFLSYDRAISASVRREKGADLAGIFTAFLAGFAVERAVPAILPRLYAAYGLEGKTLAGYPPLAERQAAAAEVLATAEELLALFEASNLAAATGRFDWAAAALGHISTYFQSRELANNLGVLFARAAMNFEDPALDQFVWPLELDWSSALSKKTKSRGGPLDAESQFFRKQLLEKAEKQFEEAVLLDPDYSTAKLNWACARLLSGDAAGAKSLFDNHFSTKKGKKKAVSTAAEQTFLAIAAAVAGDRATARTLFEAVEKAGSPLESAAARTNLRRLDGQPDPAGAAAEFDLPPLFAAQLRALEAPAERGEKRRLDDAGRWFAFEKKADGEAAFFLGDAGGPLVFFSRKKNLLAPNVRVFDGSVDLAREGWANVAAARDGYFLRGAGGEILLKIDRAGRILETVRAFSME